MRHSILRLLPFILGIAMAFTGCETVSGPPPTPVIAKPAAAKPPVADRIVVMKAQRTLELLRQGKVFETFPVSLGAHWRGPKREAGDGRTPEGVYRIDDRSEHTRYTRALHISYPNAEDRARARTMHVEPGGGIFIHGVPSDYGPYDPPQRFHDWTDGCISVGNAAIVKIWNAVPDGTPIDILP
ncbi:MAG TPA: L,D-transpeptidase family protein [Stellaceae bacterium]|nr:L,D-transpeptidase family protein [Stellaceae bacterium]